LWNYALPLFFSAVGMRLFKRLDLMSVKALCEIPQAAGFYGAANNLAIAVGLLTRSFSPLLLAKLTQLSQQGQKEHTRIMTQQAMRLVFCLLPFAGMVSGAAREVVTAIYGSTFSPAGPLLALLIFAALGFAMISVNASTLIAAGRPQLPFVLTVPLVPLAVGAHSLFVPRFGPVGAAVAQTALSWLGAGATTLAACGQCGVHPAPATILRTALTTLVAYALSSVWHTSGAWLIVKLSVLGAVIFLSLLLLGELSAQDLALAHSLVRRDRPRLRT